VIKALKQDLPKGGERNGGGAQRQPVDDLKTRGKAVATGGVQMWFLYPIGTVSDEFEVLGEGGERATLVGRKPLSEGGVEGICPGKDGGSLNHDS